MENDKERVVPKERPLPRRKHFKAPTDWMKDPLADAIDHDEREQLRKVRAKWFKEKAGDN